MRFRRLHRIYAGLRVYFWKPCPLCNQSFGGHEWRDVDGRPSTIPKPSMAPGTGIAICPDCTAVGKGRDR